MGKELVADAFSDKLIRQVRDNLPVINRQVTNGVINLDDWVVSIMPVVDTINHYVLSNSTNQVLHLEKWQARSLLQLLGFIISSAEHHYQSSNFKPGIGVERLAPAEQLCLALSVISLHPPRDTIYSYCVWNTNDKPLTFTGDEQEEVFIRVTNQIDHLYTITNDELRRLCAGLVPIDSSLASDILYSCAMNVWQAKKAIWSILEYRDGLHSVRGIEPIFFLKELRTYWPTFPLGGEIWAGASSANLASQIQLDHLIGTIDQDYTAQVVARKIYHPVECWNAIRDDLSLPSITKLLIQRFGLSTTDFENMSDDQVKNIISHQSKELLSVLKNYSDLVDASGNVTSIHWALVQNYVVKPSRDLSLEEVERLSVRPDIGSSGLSIDGVAHIRDLRKKHPVASKICRCFAEI